MGSPISVRLNDDVQSLLEAAARARGIGLATYVREIATMEARRVGRSRIREQSREVAAHVAASAEARSFFADWGTPAPLDEP